VIGAVGIIRLKPFVEQVAHLKREAQQHVARLLHAGDLRRVENALDLHVVERWDDRCHHHGGRNAGLREAPQRFQTPHRRCCARLHLARKFRIERGHR